MKIFREETDFRRDRNRHSRFGGWSGLLIKLILLIVIFIVIRNFSKDNIENVFWMFGIEKSSVESNIKD